MNFILGGVCIVSFLVLLWQWLEAARYPLHTRFKETPHSPSLTLFKPLKGCDARTIECLCSWLEQDYSGDIQFLFGVAESADPVVSPLQKLLAKFPGKETKIIFCPELKGQNRKVSSLVQMAPEATGAVWVLSDADILAPPDLLKNLVQPLQDSSVGAVNSLYRIIAPDSFSASLEAIAVNADFWSQVVQSLRLGKQDFCLGAAICMDAEVFKKTGGFEPISDLLADDYHIGNRIYKSGKSIALSTLVVDSIIPPTNLANIWKHQLRWARTIRFERPISYALSIISNTTFWALLWLFAGTWEFRYLICLPVLLIRAIAVNSLRSKIEQRSISWCTVWLAWVKDLFQFALWLGAFTGRHVIWRGVKLRVRKGGVLEPLN
ncbi:MAG: glycosyltransferase [Limisphaerales bacterium]